jgi:hypothetical protein
MKSKIVLTTLALCILFSCKKKSEDVTPAIAVDPVVGEWYLQLSDADNIAPAGSKYYAFRAPILGNVATGNIGVSTSQKSLYQITKVSEGKYTVTSKAYPNQYLSYFLSAATPLSYVRFSSPSTLTDNELFKIVKDTNTNTYYFIAVANTDRGLGAFFPANTSILSAYFVAGGVSGEYYKWKLEK